MKTQVLRPRFSAAFRNASFAMCAGLAFAAAPNANAQSAGTGSFSALSQSQAATPGQYGQISTLPAPSGMYSVQLAAMSSEQSARQVWQSVQDQSPGIMFGMEGFVQRLERENASTLYRLRAGVFSDSEDANTFCLMIQEAGQQCIVVRL